MRTYTYINKPLKVIKEISCNKCGYKVDLDKLPEDGWIYQEIFQNIVIKFGYGSGHDGEEWNFDLCESCLDELKKSFKIKLEEDLF
jgi:hypothetical protein